MAAPVRSVTQRDVARLAGVSPRTVSNVVSGNVPVAEDTRRRVQRALDQLGYRVNASARNLRRGRSGLLALVLPLRVPYFTDLADAIIDEARQRSFTVVIDKSDENRYHERELIGPAIDQMLFDGMIVNPMEISDRDLLRIGERIPIVLLGQWPGISGLDRVLLDDAAAARAATQHLLDLGRSRVAVIGCQPHGPGQHRTAGYLRALSAAGVPRRPEYEAEAVLFQRRDGAEAMERLLALPEPPDAVFCYNDLLALGALRTLHERGVRVPEDVALVGFDDVEDGRFSFPSLTSIAQDRQQIARLALDTLIERIGGDAGPARVQYADWRLVPRESTLGR